MAPTTIQTTSARPHRVLLRFLLCALILVAIVPRAFPFALATTTDTDGVVEFGGRTLLKIAGGDIAELGDAEHVAWSGTKTILAQIVMLWHRDGTSMENGARRKSVISVAAEFC